MPAGSAIASKLPCRASRFRGPARCLSFLIAGDWLCGQEGVSAWRLLSSVVMTGVPPGNQVSGCELGLASGSAAWPAASPGAAGHARRPVRCLAGLLAVPARYEARCKGRRPDRGPRSRMFIIFMASP